jgi:hypothetical protein
MMTKDGTRRRTLGGVFFELARWYTSSPVRYLVMNRKGKPLAPKAEGETANPSNATAASS